MKVIVVCSSDYSFHDRLTGELREGANFFFISPFNNNSNVNGNEISKISLALNEYQKFGFKSMDLPAICEIELMTGTTIKGKAFSKLTDVKFIESINLLDLID